jgi:hypothetical protein
MSSSLRLALLALAGLFLTLRAEAAPKPEKESPLFVRMQDRVNTNGIEDAKTTLAEVLEQYSKLFNLPITINERAFQDDNANAVLKAEIVAIEPLPPMKNARLDTVLQRVLSRVPCESGATFTIRSDRIEITTTKAQRAEFWPHVPEEANATYFPLVHADFEKKPLDAALKELVEQTEVTIVLDTKVIEKEMPAVTARLANTPLDSAVIILAEMTDLRPVRMGRTIFVTSPKKAEALEKRLNPPQPALGGFGAPCFPFAPLMPQGPGPQGPRPRNGGM